MSYFLTQKIHEMRKISDLCVRLNERYVFSVKVSL